MNGSLVLLLFSLLAQSGIGPLGANQTSNQGFSDSDSSSNLTQYGWQINDANELEYLIQISPEMLPYMTRAQNQKEFASEIPRELLGRIRRVVVSVGTQVLPRRPSLQEIQQMVPIIASLPGRHRDLDPDAIVTNVSNNQYPEPPTGFGGSASALGNQGGAASTQAPSMPLGGAFLDQARAGSSSTPGTGPGRPSLPANSPALNSNLATSNPQLSQPPVGRFADTASGSANPTLQSGSSPSQFGQQAPRGGEWQASSNSIPLPNTPSGPSGNVANSNWAGNQAGVSPVWPGGNSTWPSGNSDPNALVYNPGGQQHIGSHGDNNLTQNQYQNGSSQANSASNTGFGQPGYGQQPNYSPQQGYSQPTGQGQFVNNPGATGYPGQYESMNPSRGYDRNGSAFPSTSGGFGDMSGHPGQSIADRTRGDDQWASSFANHSPVRRPGETLIASRPRDLLASSDHAGSSSDFSSSNGLVRGSEFSRESAERIDQRQTSISASNSNYHLFVFFVLSVAVNLWMVHLLRSLYIRYRTLLTSLRGQAANVVA